MDRIPERRCPMSLSSIAIYLPQIVAGGAENNFAKIASALFRRGYPVTVLVSTLNRPFSPYLDPGIKVVELKPVLGMFRLPVLLRYLREQGPSILLCALEGPILLGCFIKALGLTKTRVVVSLRNRDDMVI